MGPSGPRKKEMNGSTEQQKKPLFCPEKSAERARRFALAALAGELRRFEAAGEGERNAVLNRAAFRAFQLVPSGALTADEVAAAFEAAGLASGLRPAQVRDTLRSAAQGGQRNPRELRFEPGRRPQWRANQEGVRPAVRTAPRHSAPSEPPRRPPLSQVMALWTAARPVGLTTTDPSPRGYLDACAYLQARGWWPPAVAALDLVKVLPEPDFSWPAWWPWGPSGRWLLGALLYEADGSPASIQARAVELPGWPLPEDEPKARCPRGFEARELLFADHAGLALLRGEGPPPASVLLAEGLTDTLALALYARRQASQGEHLAVLGMVAGSAPALARVAWPPGCTVIGFMDSDEAGEKYAIDALNALPDSVTFLRAELPHEKEG